MYNISYVFGSYRYLETAQNTWKQVDNRVSVKMFGFQKPSVRDWLRHPKLSLKENFFNESTETYRNVCIIFW